MNRLDDAPPDSPADRTADESEDPRVTRAVEEYLAAAAAGRPPERDVFLARHPEIAGELAECLDGLEFIRAAAPRLQQQVVGRPECPTAAEPDHPLPSPLGDYR